MSQMSLPRRIAFVALPLAVISSIAAVALAYITVSSREWDVVSLVSTLAAAIVVLSAFATIGWARWLGLRTERRLAEVRAAVRRVTDADLNILADSLRNPDPDTRPIGSLWLDTDEEDEIGALNRAFADLHRNLVKVAERQMESLKGGVSDLIVTLARRNTSLVDRQIALLDALEEREEDAGALANFYQIDHLATRMRRNAESLLVLAGADSPRTWNEPMPIADVLRGAVSEVDDYRRVDLVAVQPIMVRGSVIADLAHLIAELLENATSFSPPEQTVRVVGSVEGDGYRLRIVDRGLGIDQERLASLNDTLENPPPLGLRLAPTMGIYVVAQLAARHGIEVVLTGGDVGLTANILIPPWLLERADQVIDLDAESQDYIAKMRRRRIARENTLVRTPASRGPSDVEVEDSTATLPTRTPGTTAGGTVHGAASATAEGGGEIRSALTAFDRGRRAASEGAETEIVDLEELQGDES